MRNEDGNKLIRDLLRRNFPCGSQLVKNPPAIQGTWVQSLYGNMDIDAENIGLAKNFVPF